MTATRSLPPFKASKYELISAGRGEHHTQGTPGARRARQDIRAGLQVLRRGRGRRLRQPGEDGGTGEGHRGRARPACLTTTSQRRSLPFGTPASRLLCSCFAMQRGTPSSSTVHRPRSRGERRFAYGSTMLRSSHVQRGASLRLWLNRFMREDSTQLLQFRQLLRRKREWRPVHADVVVGSFHIKRYGRVTNTNIELFGSLIR